ncbi:MAG TPA: NAD-dependent epimerase/dehydratase family protein, partial [Casimicrobiaceae bacterium]
MVLVVTGADGFIGRACVPLLLRAGYDVRGLVRALGPDTVARAEYLAAGDLTQLPESSMRLVLRGADAVVHLAGIAHREGAAPEA